MSVDDEFQSYSELRMEMPCRRAPEHTLAARYAEHDAVGDIGFRLQRHRASVEKSLTASDRGAVVQHFISPVHRLVPQHGRAADVEKEGLGAVCEKLIVVAPFARELRHGDTPGFVGVIAAEVLRPEDPLVRTTRITAHGRSEVVPRGAAPGGGVPAVRHARAYLQPPHSGQGTLGMGFWSQSQTEGQRQQ